MKALLLHCRNYLTKVDKLANRPKDIEVEELKEREQSCKDCIVALITIEKGDKKEETSAKLVEEIIKFSQEIGHKNIVLLPFAHLSNNLAISKDAIKVLDSIEGKITRDFKTIRAHFGSHKSLLLDIYGHVGNARFREF